MGRKKKKYHFIYKTTNLLSGKYYIGMHSTDNLDDGYMGSGKRLRYSINKYGKDNHKVEILEFVDTRELLKLREEEIVNLNEIAKIDCINLKVGGSGGFSSEEHMIKFIKSGSEAGVKILKEKHKNSKFKEKWCESRKIAWENLSEIKKEELIKHLDWEGKNHSEETKKKMSESSKGMGNGSKNSQYGTCWITRDGSNKKIKKEDLDEYLEMGWIRGRK